MDGHVHSLIQELDDLELAILICLIAREHCILSTEHEIKQDLREEIRLICTSTFRLQTAVVDCSSGMTVDEFSAATLVESDNAIEDSLGHLESSSGPTLTIDDSTVSQGRFPGRFGSNMLDERRIADMIIISDLDLASENVQMQALELLRTKRIFTRTAMHSASKDFMVLAISSRPGARLSHHLNDLFCMYHYHSGEDDFLLLNGQNPTQVVRYFSNSEITELRRLADEVRFTPELAAYLHNIVVFMRSSRFVNGGVTATATRQLRAISKTLAPLHGLKYVPPSLVALAAHKIYPHRLKLATAETERSLQWGSDPKAVQRVLADIDVEFVIDDVLASVETPL